ncbi:MAG: uroporphyrinogen-III synthase [Bacteroidales bacterium]|nr:uroporphyrinogen-III synthase [Bacteroidales bacterium]
MKIKNILLSQNLPEDFEKSPYANLKKKYGVNFDFYKFFRLETISSLEFRKQKINVLEHTAIIFSSKNTIDAFFSLMKEVRLEMPETMKYYCSTDSIAFYLQKHIQYRKRKIFYPKINTSAALAEILTKNKQLDYLVPCGTGEKSLQLADFFAKYKVKYSKIEVFQIVSNDLKNDVDLSKYDMLVFFSPFGIRALKENFPDLQPDQWIIGALGTKTVDAIKKEGWPVHVMAPTKEALSITAALDIFCKGHVSRRR